MPPQNARTAHVREEQERASVTSSQAGSLSVLRGRRDLRSLLEEETREPTFLPTGVIWEIEERACQALGHSHV